MEWDERLEGALPETERGEGGFGSTGHKRERETGRRSAEAGLPRDVYALLAQANLLRMRGCWEDAVQSCMAALRLSPESSSAQSLLGDIYENQGRHDDAVQWYRMALDVHPDSPADRIKLDRLLRLQDEAPLRPSVAARLPLVPNRHAQREPLRLNPETTLRYAALGAALLVLLIVLLAYLSVHRQAALASLGLGSGQEVEIKPVIVPSAISSAPTAAASVGGIRDGAEQTLLDALNASSDLKAQGITVSDIEADPRTGSLAITYSAGGSLSREAVLRAALRVVQAATLAPGGQTATVFTVRCLLPASGGTAARLWCSWETSRGVRFQPRRPPMPV